MRSFHWKAPSPFSPLVSKGWVKSGVLKVTPQWNPDRFTAVTQPAATQPVEAYWPKAESSLWRSR
jgi:hypothetical protein